jgi:hypothetical protein
MIRVEDMFYVEHQYRTNNNHCDYYKQDEQANVDMLRVMNEGNIDDRQLKKRKSAASLVHN